MIDLNKITPELVSGITKDVLSSLDQKPQASNKCLSSNSKCEKVHTFNFNVSFQIKDLEKIKELVNLLKPSGPLR